MISIVIPVYNDPEGLEDTLSSLVNQDFDGKYEILPVDNNSTDDTAKVVDSFQEKYDYVRGLKENKIQGSYAARNKGIQKARGDVLLFIDADITADQTFLSTAVERFKKSSYDYAGINVEIQRTKDNIFSKYNAFQGFPIERHLEKNNFAPTCSLIVRKDVVDDVGRFDEMLVSNGDAEFGKKVDEEGYNQGFINSTTLYHPARETLKSLKNRYFRYGKGWSQRFRLGYIDRHPRNPRNFLPTPPLRFLHKYSDNKNWNSLSKIEKVEFYILEYYFKLCRSYSALKHYYL